MPQPKPATQDSKVADFRDAFRGHPAGVSIITATVDGQPVGLTASSVASLSLNPLAVSFSLMKATGTAGQLLRADSFLIHLLSAEQADIAASFAGSGVERFHPDQEWDTAETGEPLLPHSRAVLRARTIDTIQSGEATLVAAEVLDVTLRHQPADVAEPEALIFKGHKFYSLATTPPLA